MSISKETAAQAFPFIERVWCTDTDQYVLGESTTGMTLRDYFAAKALQGLLANPNRAGSVDDFVVDAFTHADGMLGARK